MKKDSVSNKIKNIICAILGGIFVICIAWCCLNKVLTRIEMEKNVPLGKMVDVDGGLMHVYEKGEGDDTIVLLSGLGTTAPAIDFTPLINELKEYYKVVVIEPFGYGWSEETRRKRTIVNIVEELREALQKADVKPPYIFMAHSYSGIYSMYYANKYPDDIKAFIGNDSSMPNQMTYFDGEYKKVSPLMSYIAPTGVARLAMIIMPDSFLPKTPDGTYTKDERRLIKTITSWKGYNSNIVSEMNEMEDTIKETESMRFRDDMPVLYFMKEAIKKRADGKTRRSMYEIYLTQNNASKIVELDGHHYLHWSNSKQMGETIDNFIKKINQNIND